MIYDVHIRIADYSGAGARGCAETIMMRLEGLGETAVVSVLPLKPEQIEICEE